MRFSKWHAHGNSYLLVEREELGRPLTDAQARRLCDPRTGVGSDGVLEVVSVDRQRIEIVIWNPDGTVAEFSGNGTRIAAAWALRDGGEHVTVETAGRSYVATVRDDLIEMEVGPVAVRETETIQLQTERLEVTPVSVGNPHAVLRTDGGRKELLRLGPLVETHERFPERTNVQFVRVTGASELDVLVWERGAGETSASGSSAVAAAAVAIVAGWAESPVTVRMPGGELLVALDEENRATLTGPAEQICVGETLCF